MEVLSGGGKGKSDVLSGNTGGDYSILINTSEDNEKEVSVTEDVRTGPFYHWEYQVEKRERGDRYRKGGRRLASEHE